MIIIVINKGDTDIFIEDLGITIPKSSSIELVGVDGLYSLDKVTASFELKDLVQSRKLIISNGKKYLSAKNGVKLLTLKTEYDRRNKCHW